MISRNKKYNSSLMSAKGWRLAIWGILILISLYFLTQFLSQSITFENNQLPVTNILPADYKNVFKGDKVDSIRIIEVHNSRARHPIAVCLVKDSFTLIINKIDIASKRNIDNLIGLFLNKKDIDNGSLYYDIIDSLVAPLSVKATPVTNKIEQLSIYSEGQLLEKMRNGNYSNFHLKAKNFAITLEKNGDPEFYFPDYYEPSVSKEPIFEMNISFQRQSDDSYVIFLMLPSKKTNRVLTGAELLDFLKNP